MHFDQSELKRFQDSLDRATGSERFLGRFYDRFMGSSKEMRDLFQDKDMDHIQEKLKMTLQMVNDSASGTPGLEMYLGLLGRIHTRLQISPEQFQQWRHALIETASECDPEFDERIRRSWEQVIDNLIAKMQDDAATE